MRFKNAIYITLSLSFFIPHESFAVFEKFEGTTVIDEIPIHEGIKSQYNEQPEAQRASQIITDDEQEPVQQIFEGEPKKLQLKSIGPVLRSDIRIYKHFTQFNHRVHSSSGKESIFQLQPYGAFFVTREADLSAPKIDYLYCDMRLDCLFTPNPRLSEGRIVNLVSHYIVQVAAMQRHNSTWKPTSSVKLVAILPNFSHQATEGETKTADEMAIQVDGRISVGKKSDDSAEVGGSFDLRRNVERATKDVEIAPSMGIGSSAMWRIQMNNLVGRREGGNTASRSTYAKSFHFMWKINYNLAVKQGLFIIDPDLGDGEDYYLPIGFHVDAAFQHVWNFPSMFPLVFNPLLKSPFKRTMSVISDDELTDPNSSFVVYMVKIPRRVSSGTTNVTIIK